MKLFGTILAVSAILVVTTGAPVQGDDGEYGEYFEGDMKVTQDQLDAITAATHDRNGLRNVASRWPNRTVVYHIREANFDRDQVATIERAMADIANHSCIQFRTNTTAEEAHVVIQGSARGCYSQVGYHGTSDQVLNFGRGCFRRYGTIIHELLHMLGFFHMQSTYNRDDFVRIDWDNIMEGRGRNFQMYTDIVVDDFGVAYDYGSVLHYSAKAFSKNGLDTIVPLQEGVNIGQRVGLSESDILKLNRMYCPAEETTTEAT